MEKSIGKLICFVMRHKPEVIDVKINKNGWIDVDVELKQTFPPDALYQGTDKKYLASIQKDGLIPKVRLYVHLSADTEVAENIGKRHGEVVIFELDCRAMVLNGFLFYRSANNVWLTKLAPVKYFKLI